MVEWLELRAKDIEGDSDSPLRVSTANNYWIAAALITSLAERNKRLEEALKPFADCMEYIGHDEDDEEWAKFRLLVKDYRRARAALSPPTSEEGNTNER
jgi:hypothetical protein